MKPWSDEALRADLDDDAAEALWESVTAADFYFYLGEDDVSITPIEYFDAYGRMYDQHLLIDHLLPADLTLMSEGVWENDTDMNVPQLRAELIRRGFVEHADLLADFKDD